MSSLRTPLLLGLAVALTASGGVAQAQEDTPAVVCPPATQVADDPAGDAKIRDTAVDASGNLDITKVTLGPTPGGTAEVALTIPTLDKTVPPYTTGLAWYVEYTVSDSTRFVAASLAPDGTVSYHGGADGRTYSSDATTTGSFETGSPGTITIALPDVFWGDELTTMRAIGFQSFGVAVPGVGSAAFLSAADTAAMTDHTVETCEEPAAA